jgi:monoamine oxidase
LEAISRPVLTQAEILLNTKAEKITYRSGTGDSVQVFLQGGQTLVFDEVVVTAPLGWLKRNTDAFSPRLPPRLTKAIGSLGYGCLEKVLVLTHQRAAIDRLTYA